MRFTVTTEHILSGNNSPFLHYWLVSSFEIINIGNTGNQNHPDLEVRVVLVTCISNIDFLKAGNQSIMQIDIFLGTIFKTASTRVILFIPVLIIISKTFILKALVSTTCRSQ